MANNLDPELIGILLMVLRRHASGRLNRKNLFDDWIKYSHGWSIHFRRRLLASNASREEILRHVEFMADLGLIKRRTELAEGLERDIWDEWQLCSDEEFGNGNGARGAGGGGNDGGGVGGGGGQDDDGQGGSRGIGEVLRHPVLFSLPEVELVALIENLFEGPGAP